MCDGRTYPLMRERIQKTLFFRIDREEHGLRPQDVEMMNSKWILRSLFGISSIKLVIMKKKRK